MSAHQDEGVLLQDRVEARGSCVPSVQGIESVRLAGGRKLRARFYRACI